VPTTTIPDFSEKLESDFYPDNTLLVMENLYYNPSEFGFTIDEENKTYPLTLDEKTSFI
jgi:hypothetical protein